MDPISEIMQKNNDDLSQFQDKTNQQNKDRQQKNSQNSKPDPEQKAQSKATSQKEVKPGQTKKNSLEDSTLTSKPQISNLTSKMDKIAIKLDRIISLLENPNSTNSKEQKQPQVIDELEGVFDGKHMIGSDTNKYEVPYDFANKQNLVEGDLLKLKINDDGSYNYEVLEAVERKRLVGIVKRKGDKNWIVQLESKQFRIRKDFIDNKNIVEGDKVVILVPKHGKSNWGAIENVF
ncbi:MAG: hypothetical protein BRC22_00020 [Parcubacteria group bacterium QH_9_35_7]|nr:MAG: hypothetical protein BRC22_00020 [Parcubacteria group bacterium QH_9_35_7]